MYRVSAQGVEARIINVHISSSSSSSSSSSIFQSGRYPGLNFNEKIQIYFRIYCHVNNGSKYSFSEVQLSIC